MTESELVFTELLDCSREQLYLNRNCKLSQDRTAFLANALRRRLRAEPIQYILGRIEFMGLQFRLTPDVFIPRPETEILVETALKYSLQFTVYSLQLRVLDIGTGSGCIAISLAKFLKDAKVSATDISMEALGIARQNALLNNVRIRLWQSDLFSNCGLRNADYDLIVSNPPYIPANEIGDLQPELSCEPRIALDGGKNGLDFYRRIIKETPLYLKQGGFLILEMGFGQCLEIKKLFKSAKRFEIIEVVKDYQDIDRVIVVRSKVISF